MLTLVGYGTRPGRITNELPRLFRIEAHQQYGLSRYASDDLLLSVVGIGAGIGIVFGSGFQPGLGLPGPF